jgi:hypothetical protein
MSCIGKTGRERITQPFRVSLPIEALKVKNIISRQPVTKKHIRTSSHSKALVRVCVPDIPVFRLGK